MAAKRSGESEYWQQVGVQLPRELAAEWRKMVAARGRGAARLHVTAALVLWLELKPEAWEAVLGRLAPDLMLGKKLDAGARREAAREVAAKGATKG